VLSIILPVRIDDEITVLLGCDFPVILRLVANPSGRDGAHHQVIGPCYVHHLGDAVPLLGPLPALWIVQRVFNRMRHSTYRFLNPGTGEVSEEDPRLEPLEDWERIEVERTRDHPPICQFYRNARTGVVLNSDPRMEADALRARGCELLDFVLV